MMVLHTLCHHCGQPAPVEVSDDADGARWRRAIESGTAKPVHEVCAMASLDRGETTQALIRLPTDNASRSAN